MGKSLSLMATVSELMASVRRQTGSVSSELEDARRAQEYWASLGVDIGMNVDMVKKSPTVSFIIDETINGFIPISTSQFRVSSKVLIKKAKQMESFPSMKKCLRAFIQGVKNLPMETYNKIVEIGNSNPDKMFSRILTEFDKICEDHGIHSRKSDDSKMADIVFERALHRFGGYMGVMNLFIDILNYISEGSTENMTFNRCYSCKNARAERFTATQAETRRKCIQQCRTVPDYLTTSDIVRLYADVSISNGIMVSDYIPLPIESCRDYVIR